MPAYVVVPKETLEKSRSVFRIGVLVGVLCSDDQVGLVVAETEDAAEALILGVAPLRKAVASREIKALELLVEDDVDHAADRFRAVDGRRTVLEDFDALHQRRREEVDIRERDTAERRRRGVRQTTAIEEDEGGQAVDGDRGTTAVALLFTLALDWPRLPPPEAMAGLARGQHAEHVFLAGRVTHRLVDRVHRGRSDFFGGRDVGARDDDPLAGSGFRGLGGRRVRDGLGMRNHSGRAASRPIR